MKNDDDDGGNNSDDEDERRNADVGHPGHHVFLARKVEPRETNYDAGLVTSNYIDPAAT